MYVLTVHTARHEGGTKFYRTVVASGPKSSVAIYQWGAIKGGIPVNTFGTSRSGQFYRSRGGAWSDASKKQMEKRRRGYTFVEEHNLQNESLLGLMESEGFKQVLSDADQGRILTSMLEPVRAEMEGMECIPTAFIKDKVRESFPPVSPIFTPPSPASAVAVPEVNPTEHYGDAWGSW
ncbi:hypothetical protein [Cupriavidus metallidurans]|uniref:hypothetical protein n=1 Tax=Cupriavidus metallidurans TaxID=119219 RepID=UPI001CCE2692|nr:hypothetical protein [Cupriavidus metallidurans]UBM12736.1 hypothetical protein LAI70_28395 [Cupriavidus metallidurans]